MKESYFRRKLFAPLISAIILSVLMGLTSMFNGGNLGFSFIFWSFFYFMYTCIIILVYGNLISSLIEFFFNKWGREDKFTRSFYILLHGVFGIIVAPLLSAHWSLAIFGGTAAIIYGFLDVWMLSRFKRGQGLGRLPLNLASMFLVVSLILVIFGE
ncbi:hypothetical protein [Fictibacillus barbaricus]|uniref:Uncharacterized protein n=1 Tax=Fictibacillus barbaricus TaxID=182136 RepID=A0ABU1U1H5_9BACL|nr:hypothetical protein [Fictibacillus barbaricus]MDR7073312.1 hypothetical protein [Fictibacillus barbaricus]